MSNQPGQSDQFLLWAQRVAIGLSFLHADSEDSHQTGHMFLFFSLKSLFDTFQAFYPVGKKAEEIEIKPGDVLVSVAVPHFKSDISIELSNFSVVHSFNGQNLSSCFDQVRHKPFCAVRVLKLISIKKSKGMDQPVQKLIFIIVFSHIYEESTYSHYWAHK